MNNFIVEFVETLAKDAGHDPFMDNDFNVYKHADGQVPHAYYIGREDAGKSIGNFAKSVLDRAKGSSKHPPACVDCKWYKPNSSTGDIYLKHLCCHPRIVFDEVIGYHNPSNVTKLGGISAQIARGQKVYNSYTEKYTIIDTECGTSGILFEQRKISDEDE